MNPETDRAASPNDRNVESAAYVVPTVRDLLGRVVCAIHRTPLAQGIGFAPDWCPRCEGERIAKEVLRGFAK